jgi:hypothetical protein
MQSLLRQSVRPVIALLLVTLFLIPTDLRAQNHVVSPADLQRQVMSASQQRQHNIDNLQQFLSTPLAQKAMKDANINPRQVQNAIPALSDQDLVQLSARADKAQRDFAAGDLSQRDILLIVLAVVVLVLIIVAVR